MRKSKLLKAIGYIAIPILALIIILSVFYEIGKEDLTNIKEDSEYFTSKSFLNNFMGVLASQTQNLIYHNDRYQSITDGEIKLFYNNGNSTYYDYYTNIKDYYYVISYDNLVLTNIELTTETDTLEKLINFLNNQDAKKANIINGNVEAESEIISNKSIQYFEDFKNTYYTITSENEVNNYPYTTEDSELEEALENSTSSVSKTDSERLLKTYHTATINDLKIYTSYKEELLVRNNDAFYRKLVKQLEPYETQMFYALPICTIALVIICIYLIVAIGHVKNKDEIDINDFDKIPIEIILFIAVTLVACILGSCIEFVGTLFEEYYNFAISILITAYFVSYIVCALSCITLIKRIKAKTLIKSSITGRLLKWCFKIITKILRQIKKGFKEIVSSLPTTGRVIMFIFIYIIGVIILTSMFEEFGVFLTIIITGFLVYKFIERINCYKKIEEHLKKMYEGDHSNKLIPSNFTPEFQDIVRYINDVSSGFENAIEEGIKSEKLKTELITNVSHDIKTPLTSIITYADLLKKEEITNPKIKEYIDILDNKSQRLKKLTEDLVEASKASSGNVKLNIEKINIVELIKQSTGEFEDRFNSRKLEIITQIPEGIVYINADSRYMYRIIENLFSNISKYALESSRVYIDIKRIGGQVKISVKNISKERLNISADELMQRFVRGDKSRTTEGSGLGISISKSLTEIQNGKFDLQVDGDLFKVELEFDIV